MHDLDLPRVALYSTWGGTQDVGWVRYAFDQFDVPYELIYKERVAKGSLRAAYDVIVVPHQGGNGKRLVFDIESRGKPIPYKKDPKLPSLVGYGEADDITRGRGPAGRTGLDKLLPGR